MHIQSFRNVAFEGNICVWYVYVNGIVTKVVLFLLICAVMWGLYVNYSSSQGDIYMHCDRHICLWNMLIM